MQPAAPPLVESVVEPVVESVNVGRPREVFWKGRQVLTGIFKEPVAGRVAIRRLNLEGDQQADLRVHGGPDMAVYVYPAELLRVLARAISRDGVALGHVR